MESSLRRARTLVASLLTVVALTVAAPAADAGDRVTIAVAGDSVSEGYTTPGSLRLAFVPNIADALVRRGFARGGVGLVPAMPFRWQFSRAVGANASSVPPGAWRLMGFGIDVKGLDGPSTYSAVAESPKAVASASVRGPNVRLLFTTTPTPTPFRVRAGNKTWELDTYAPAPSGQWASRCGSRPARADRVHHGGDDGNRYSPPAAPCHRHRGSDRQERDPDEQDPGRPAPSGTAGRRPWSPVTRPPRLSRPAPPWSVELCGGRSGGSGGGWCH